MKIVKDGVTGTILNGTLSQAMRMSPHSFIQHTVTTEGLLCAGDAGDVSVGRRNLLEPLLELTYASIAAASHLWN